MKQPFEAPSMQGVLVALTAAALLLAVVPAGVAIDRRLQSALEQSSRDDLERAGRILEDRTSVQAGALMMHAKEVAALPALAVALSSGSMDAATAVALQAASSYGEAPVLFAAGKLVAGPASAAALAAATRRGEMPVAVVEDVGALHSVSLAPVMVGGTWVGAAGVARTWGTAEAAVLATLARAEVTILSADGRVIASTLPPDTAAGLASARSAAAAGVIDQALAERRWLTADAPLGAGRVLFARAMARELAVLGPLRRIGIASAGAALLFALVVGAVAAAAIAQPVRALADAADRLGRGDFDAPVGRPRVRELRRVAAAFDGMRASLKGRMTELRAANEELRDKQERLSSLQAELIRRDRLAAAGQLVAQLSHEIRNPVANVRNCLELVRRRLPDDTSREFADLALEELRRMHGLAERLLDMHRPGETQRGDCDAAAVAADVAVLAAIGTPAGPRVTVPDAAPLPVGMPADALKQVLVSLVQNAREAMRGEGAIEMRLRRSGRLALIDVLDEGPGIAADVLPRIFDPFFTTKRSVQGVGLGLFVAEAAVRSHGGRLTAANRTDRSGAVFRIELEVPAESAARLLEASA